MSIAQDTPIASREVPSNLAACAVLTAMASAMFGLFGGWHILDVGNLAWMHEGDPSQHLLGWLFFRSADGWQLPIGANPAFGELIAGSIVYSDSLPLFAVFFRLLDPLLPETFQYFGLWILLCFNLQAYFAFRVLRALACGTWTSVFGAGLILASPYMIWRLHGHEALMGHWILLAALLLYLRGGLRPAAWIVLLSIAVATHAYLAVMAGAVWTAALFNCRKRPSHVAMAFGATFAVAAAIAWFLGYFMIPGNSSGADGFGTYRTTLHSWFDTDGIWGVVLRDIPSPDGTYEGFAYLGLGVILLLGIAAAAVVTRSPKVVPHEGVYVVPLWPLGALMVGFVLYALSSTISGFGVQVIDLQVPRETPLVSTFRASGRFIWLPSYLIVFVAIRALTLRVPGRPAALLLAGLTVVQFADMHAAMKHFTHRFSNPVPGAFSASFWDEAATSYDRIALWPVHPHSREYIAAAFLAARHDMSINQAYLARHSGAGMAKTQLNLRNEASQNAWRQDTLYILADPLMVSDVARRQASGDLADAAFGEIDGVWALAPGWKGCTDACGLNTDASAPELPRAQLPADGAIEFRAGGNFEPFRRLGWSEGGDWGRWSTGPYAELLIELRHSPLRPLEITVMAMPFLAGAVTEQIVEIHANGHLMQTMSLVERDVESRMAFVIPPDLIGPDRVLTLRLDVSSPTSPVELGLSSDSRPLGLHVSSVRIDGVAASGNGE